ncbi:hypothetical protein AX15_003244 [Amanita polypyramis BW_CC]|nr:hypothetical protein AX15_003244 [Amanita polypyramis BW_CC]
MRFSTLARLRVLSLLVLLFAPTAYSREEVIFTSSVTYCEPPETLLIQQFDVIYFANNESVFFNISAASVEANVNVTANLFLNVYGLHPVNYTIDLCSIFDGALCPLPMYNFTGTDVLSLPKSLGIAGRIPSIGFKIPDLEGFAQLTLSEVGTGNVKACVQATLSNGWSTHQPAVEWVTGGFAIAALLSAVWQSWSPEALAPFILLDLFYLYQSIATTALLSLNYPSVYRAYTLNFAWAMGFLTSTNIQGSINHMRHLTGGTLADSSTGSVVGLVNRKLSPYNEAIGNLQALVTRATDPTLRFVECLVKPALYSSGILPERMAFSRSTVQEQVQTVTADSSNVLQAGVPIYVNSIHIATANAFMTIFLTTLVLSAIAVAAFALVYLMLFILARRKNPKNIILWGELLQVYPSYARAWALRLGLITSVPLLTFIFYQWTLRDSWLSILLSVFTLVAILGVVGYPVISVLRSSYIFSTPWIYSQQVMIVPYGPLYARYRASRFYFFVPTLLAVLLKSIFIAFAKANGLAQITGIVITEGLFLLALCFSRPYRTRRGDILSGFLAIVRLVCSGLLIAFLENLKVNAIKRVVIGFVIIVIFSVAVLVIFARIVFELVFDKTSLVISKGSTSSFPDRLRDSESGTTEKKSSSSWDPEQAVGRPVNPTPDHGSPRDRRFLQAHDFSTVASPTTSMGSRVSSRESGTITLGSLLPRRWSFTLSAPGSPSNSSANHQSGLLTMSDLSSSPHTPTTPVSHDPSEQSEQQHRHSSQGHQP